MTLLAAYQLVLSRYSGQDDIAVGTPVLGRERPEFDQVLGVFVNTIVLRTNLSGDLTVEDLVARVKTVCLEAYEHQAMPFEALVEQLHPERDPSRNPLFQVMLAVQELGGTDMDIVFDDLSIEKLSLTEPLAKFDLNLLLDSTPDNICGVVEYSAVLFDRSTVRRFIGSFCSMLYSFCAHPDARVSELGTISAEEEKRMVEEWNATAHGYERESLIQETIEEQAATRPEDCAVVYAGRQMSYGELNRKANQVAHLLRQRGVGPGTFVGIVMDRSAEMVVGTLAVLKSGGAYVPMEPGYPVQRKQWIISSLAVKCVLSQSWQSERLKVLDGVEDVIWLEGGRTEGPWRQWGWEEIAVCSGDNPAAVGKSTDLAYAIFTSGSTGNPKGVMVQHRPVVNLIEWVNREFRVDGGDRLLFVTSLCFDLSVYDMFGMLAAGGVVEVASQEDVSEPARLVERLYSGEVSFWDSAPAALQQLIGWLDRAGGRPSRLRLVFLSGDWIPVGLPDQIRELFGAGVEVIGLGGATEATVWSNYYRIGKVETGWASIPYGRPIQNSRYHVLDQDLNCCAVGVSGDLYIGGDCLSLGYANEPGLTADKYIPDRYAEQPGARLYRTGDRARYWEDGTLEFLGRADQQVKIRGYRVEVGEVEATLRQHPGLRQVLVLADGQRGDKRLIAYLVGTPNSEATTQNLRSYLQQRLPEYMVPSAFVWLKQMPVTHNGKLDRKALPAPDHQPASAPSYSPPSGPLQQLLADIWCDVLRRDSVGVDDNFFEIGGHSLLAMELLSRIRDIIGPQITLRNLFEFPTIAELSNIIRSHQRGNLETRTEEPRPMARPERIPLSFAQERQWFLAQLETVNPGYLIPLALRVRGPLDIQAAQAALNAIVQRHEVMRTSFYSEDGVPFQRVDAAAALTIEVQDFTEIPASDHTAAVQKFLATQALVPFDLQSAPLARARLVQFAADDHTLILIVHHIIFDGWSVDILLREFALFYEPYSKGQTADVPALPYQYADFSLWQRQYMDSEAFLGDVDYWDRHTSRTEPVTLPLDHSRTERQINEGQSIPLDLGQDLSQGLLRLTRREKMTVFMTLLTGIVILMHRCTGREDITIGSPAAGRDHLAFEPLIGLFVNTLALRTIVNASLTIRQTMSLVRETCLGAFAHADVPFGAVVERTQPHRDANKNPLFQVIFVMNAQRERLRGSLCGDIACQELIEVLPEAKFDITIEVTEDQGRLAGFLLYNSALYSAETTASFRDRLTLVYDAMAKNPDQLIGDIPLVTELERALLESWSTSSSR
jgi:amino acid adenylation domain-containing protein